MLDMYEISKRLEIHEGFRSKPYRCSCGKLTIGIGRCLDTNPLTREEEQVVGDWRNGITRNAAIYLLRNDIKRVEAECVNNIVFWQNLDDERQYALIDMVFQMGISGVLKFKKMLAALAVGNYKIASAECLDSQYAVQTPNRAERIARLIAMGKFLL